MEERREGSLEELRGLSWVFEGSLTVGLQVVETEGKERGFGLRLKGKKGGKGVFG